MPSLEPITVTILAGGHGSRLGGVDKSALDVNGQPLLERVLDVVAPLAREIVVVANDDRLTADPRLTVIRDPEAHGGVLPALLAALETATSDRMLLIACDMPFLSRPLIEHLVELSTEYDAVVPKVDGFEQVMHAVYRVEPCRAAVRAALEHGRRRMIAFLDDVRTLTVDESDLRPYDPALRSFFNVNTPDDLDLARRLASASQDQ
jgi:molybdopterin-guanine dinucleotide biosynthesis protein A